LSLPILNTLSQRIRITGVLLGTALALCLATADSAGAAPSAGKSVIGGGDSNIGEFPYAVAILKDGKFHCTGSILSDDRVLTAGHCVADPAQLTVVSGREEVSEGGGQALPVTGVALHDGYKPTKKGALNDIAMFAIGGHFKATPIALPTDDSSFVAPGTALTSVGYGERNPNYFTKRRSGRLTKAQVFVRRDCPRRVDNYDPATMICALGRKAGKVLVKYPRRTRKRTLMQSPCHGDSGGPLVTWTEAGAVQVGIASFKTFSGKKFFFVLCGLRRRPVVWTRVSAYLPWIQALMAAPDPVPNP
jgi:secreted trypsin-like serine protease